MQSWSFILAGLCFFGTSITLSLLSAEETFQYLGNYYKRNNYENANFDELFEDFYTDPNITQLEYKYMINKGLSSFFLLSDRIEKLKHSVNEHLINDQLRFSPSPSARKDFAFYSIIGLSHFSPGDTELLLNESLPYYEIKCKIHLSSITFKGVAEYGGANQSVDYEMDDILYSDWQRKKVNDNFEIKLFRSSEKFHANATKLIIKSATGVDGQYLQLENEIAEEISKYLPKVVEQVRIIAKNATLAADTRYLQTIKQNNVRKLSILVSDLIRTYRIVRTNIPRFAFVDESSSTTFDLISGVFEVDTEKTNVSLMLQQNGDFFFSTPTEGTLTYFVSEQNCTESCNTYGDRARIRAVNVTLTLNSKKIEKVYVILDTQSGSGPTDNYSYLRKPAQSVIESTLIKVSNIFSERLLTRIKSFLT